MIANKPGSWKIAIGLLAVSTAFLSRASVGVAQESPPSGTTLTTEEVIAAIKRRAERALEERRRAKPLQWFFEFSSGGGYEKNPSYSQSHKGDSFVEEDLFMEVSKKLTPTLTWGGTYSNSYVNYFELTDDTYTYQTLTPLKLIWQPDRRWRLDSGVDLDYLWYPNNSPANYQELKPWIGVRQNLWGSWYQSARYLWFLRHYVSAKARNGLGTGTRSPREDTRNTLRYEVGTDWLKTSLKARGEWYLNDSNDARQDFYDAEDYKLTGFVSRPLTEKLSLSASYTFERKSYLHRQVIGVQRPRARYDDIQTYSVFAIYDINKTWSLNPRFSYTHLNSNEPTGEYFDYTVSGVVTAKF